MSTTTTARMGPSPSHNWFLEKCKKTACWILFQVGLRSPGIMRRPKLSCGAPAAALQGVINGIMRRVTRLVCVGLKHHCQDDAECWEERGDACCYDFSDFNGQSLDSVER